MAHITTGDAYVDTVLGTDDADETGAHGGGPGADAFKSLKALVANKLDTLTGNLTVHCVGGSETITGTIAISGLSASDKKLTIIGDRWDDKTSGLYSTSKYNILQTNYNDHALAVTELNIEFDGMQIDVTTTGSGNYGVNILTAAAAQVITFKNCIIRQTGAGTNTRGINFTSLFAGSTIKVFNCIIYNMTFAGLGNSTAITFPVSNCTFHANTTAILEGGGTLIVKNCVLDSNTADQIGAWEGTSDYNCTTINAALNPDGAHDSHNCAAFAFSDLANHDFRLTAGSTDLRNNGVTIAACTPDPLGTARPSETNYSRGAFEYAAAGGHGAIKRFAGVPHMAVNRGVW